MLRTASLIAPILLLLAACDGSGNAGGGTEGATDTDDGTGSDTDTDTDGGEVACGAPVGFSESPIVWSLPTGDMIANSPGLPVNEWLVLEDCGESRFHTRVQPQDAEPGADLVVFDACDERGVGTTHWQVFSAGPEGFGPGRDWLLPAYPEGYDGEGFPHHRHAISGCEDVGTFASFRADMNGDGASDLIVLDACDEGGVGTTHWEVYFAEEDGFSEPVRYDLPEVPDVDLGFREPFAREGDQRECGDGEFDFHIYDITGDQRADLVIEARCGSLPPNTREVAAATDGGFEALQRWEGPEQSTGSCPNGTGREDWFRSDLVGDGFLDLVITGDCDDPLVGETHWVVHPGSASGYGPGQRWELPTPPNGLAYQNLFGGACEGEEARRFHWNPTDLTGDGKIDLVVSGTCDDATVGRDHWLVYPADAAGFGEEIQWAIPPYNAAQGTDDPGVHTYTKTECNGSGRFSSFLADMDGDGLEDLVVAESCGAAEIGETNWRVHLAVCE